MLVEGTTGAGSRCDDRRRAASIRSLFRSFALAAFALALCAGLVAGAGESAKAEPPLTVAEATARIDQLETDAEAIDQEYIEISEQL